MIGHDDAVKEAYHIQLFEEHLEKHYRHGFGNFEGVEPYDGPHKLSTGFRVDVRDPDTQRAKHFNLRVRRDVLEDSREDQELLARLAEATHIMDKHPGEVVVMLYVTFGGLRVNNDAQVINLDYKPIEGLFAAGELVGGLFYFNYPGGTGLTAGSVFGKIAGEAAAGEGVTGG